MRARRECVSATVEFAARGIRQTAAGVFVGILVLVQGCSSTETTVRQETVGKEGRRTTSGTPYIVVDKTVYDLGDIKPNSTHMAVFHLRNGGAGTLRITEVKRCCGAVIKLEKQELVPSESAVLTAEFHVAQGSDIFSKKIALLTNDPESEQTELTITGKVVQTLTWTPAQFEIAAFKETITCPRITIKSLDKVPFSIQGFTATGQCLAGDFDSSRKATEFKLQPRVDMAKFNALRTLNGTVRIELDHPDYKVISVPFSVVPPLQAIPPQILLFNAVAGESIIRPVQVQDNQAGGSTEAAARLESVVCKNGTRVELRAVTPDKTKCDLKVELWPTGNAEGESFSTDELVIRMKDGRELSVPVRMFYKPPSRPGTPAQSPSVGS